MSKQVKIPLSVFSYDAGLGFERFEYIHHAFQGMRKQQRGTFCKARVQHTYHHRDKPGTRQDTLSKKSVSGIMCFGPRDIEGRGVVWKVGMYPIRVCSPYLVHADFVVFVYACSAPKALL